MTTLLIIGLSILSLAVAAADEAVTLQQRGIERVKAYVDHVRKTGDDKALLPELDRADEELRLSAERFAERGEWAAALSRIWLGTSMGARNRWSEAIGFYREGYDLAKRTGNAAYQAKARIGEAMAQKFGFNDLGAVGVALGEAIALSASVPDLKMRFDALEFQGGLEADRGDLAAAFDTCSRALTVAQEAQDATLLFYGFYCRGDIYRKRAAQCDYQREFDPCYEAIDLAAADYQRARDYARQQGFDFWVGVMEKLISGFADLRRLIDMAKRYHEETLKAMLTAPFNPKTAKDVIVHEYFIREDYEKAGIQNQTAANKTRQ